MGEESKMVNKKAIKNIAKKTTLPIIMLHTIPTSMRGAYAKSNDPEIIGASGGFFGLVYSLVAGGLLQKLNLESYELIPASVFVTSNVISGLYEWYRYEAKKSETSSNIPNELETKVNTTEVKQEIKPIEQSNPIEVIDPWKVNIEELENIYSGGRK